MALKAVQVHLAGGRRQSQQGHAACCDDDSFGTLGALNVFVPHLLGEVQDVDIETLINETTVVYSKLLCKPWSFCSAQKGRFWNVFLALAANRS